MSKGVKYAFGAIGLYLLVAYAGGAKLLSTGSKGASQLVGTFQGRGKVA